MPDHPTTQNQDGLEARDSGLLLRVIADAIPASMAYFEAETLRCRFANERYARATGHTTASILGLTARETIGEDVWQSIQPHVERCTSGQPVRYTRPHRDAEGSQRMLEVHLIPHLQDGKQFGTFVLINDITHHWQAERAVRDSEERMRKFSAATEEAIVFHRDGYITDGNEALERLCGYPLSEVLGTIVFDYICPEHRATAIAYTRAQREDPYEVSILHRDGHAIPIEVVGKTMPIDGQ